MSAEQMVYLVLAVAGGVGGVYWKFSTAIGKVKDELAAHKTHIAESYVTKQGMHEQTEQILRAMESIGSRIDALTARIDSLIKPGSRRS